MIIKNFFFFYLTILLIFLQTNIYADIQVVAFKVKQEKINNELEALGTLRAKDAVTLTASVTDTVTGVYFTDGQRVSEGDLLLEMTSTEESALVRESIAKVTEAKQQYERVKNITNSGAISASVIDQRRSEYQSAKAQLSATKSRLSDRLILAPFSGVMGFKNISRGALVSPGQTIGRITNDNILNLDFSIPAFSMSAVKVDQDILAFSKTYRNKKFSGKIIALNSEVDEITRSLLVRAEIPNETHLLKPGLLMRVRIPYNFREALVVPEETILRDAEDTFVYIIDDIKNQSGVVKRKAIKTGTTIKGKVEILSGLKVDDLVVSDGIISLRDGVKVVFTFNKKTILKETNK